MKSSKEKEEIKTIITEKCLIGNRLPWIVYCRNDEEVSKVK
jgi:hypothetical protein